MAITIDWLTFVINIPKADLTLIQAEPTEIRELNLNDFRLILKDLEDDADGMGFQKTHEHYPEATVGGVTLARVINILDPYTITFEDGQYAVNLVGANSNVGDKTNVNQVSIRSANSAGLISNADIEYSSYENGVAVDESSGVTGTTHPRGTKRMPVNNLTDAMLIAAYRGLDIIYALGDLTISGGDYSDMIFVGESAGKTTITVNATANVTNCEFLEASVQGTLNGLTLGIKNCEILDLSGFNGEMFNCILKGVLCLTGSPSINIVGCADGLPGAGVPTIDCGGSGRSLGIWGYHGGLKLINKSGSESVSANLDSGRLILDSTVTNGNFIVRGNGTLEDNSSGTNVDSRGLLSRDKIAESIWNEPMDNYQTTGTFGQWVGRKLLSVAKFLGLK